jgi:hypothetical protein
MSPPHGRERHIAASKRELDDYEKGYLDGVLAFAYRSDGEVYVGRNRLMTYKAAVQRFLSKRGIEGWSVNVH